MADRQKSTMNLKTFSDASHGWNHHLPARLHRYPTYQPAHNEQFKPKQLPGSKACDPIVVLDDDKPDTAKMTMDVLHPKRKRTIGELAVNELISPARIETLSEKLARMARKRRQRQDRYDPLLQNRNAGDVGGAPELDHASGHDNDRVSREQAELIRSPTVYESLDTKDAVVRVSDERNRPSVDRRLSPPSLSLLHEDHENAAVTQIHEKDDGYANIIGMRSILSTTKNRDVQDHTRGIRAVYLRDHTFANLKSQYTKPRTGGPTNNCGVFSAKRKTPVKRSNRGTFHCPRCDSQFTTSRSVNHHFEKCVAKYGNPMSSKWNDHPSFEEAAQRTVAKTKNQQIDTGAAQVHSIQKEIASSNVPIDRQRAEYQASSSCGESKLHHPKSSVQFRGTAGKGLSRETLKKFWKTGDWNRGMEVDQSPDIAQDEEIVMPDIAYQYFVSKREWLETEEDAIETRMGPYHTMNEANVVAKAEVQSSEIDGFTGIHSSGWSYFYQQDEDGMQMHVATVLEIHIETSVHRGKFPNLRLVYEMLKLIQYISELTPHDQRASIPSSAFIVAPRVYIVHELQWLPVSPDTAARAPKHCQTFTHGVFTLLNKANQRASAEYLGTLTGNWGNSEYDVLKRTELKSDLNKKVRGLNQEIECFGEEIQLEGNGFAKVWVEMVAVEGPRN